MFEQILVTRSWPCKCKSSEKVFYKILFCLKIYLNIKIFPYANLPLKHMTPELLSLHCIEFINNKYYGQLVDTIFDFITRPILPNSEALGKTTQKKTMGKESNRRVTNFYNRLQSAKYKLFSWWFGLYNEGCIFIVLLHKNNYSCVEIDYIRVSFLNFKLIQV